MAHTEETEVNMNRRIWWHIIIL